MFFLEKLTNIVIYSATFYRLIEDASILKVLLMDY